MPFHWNVVLKLNTASCEKYHINTFCRESLLRIDLVKLSQLEQPRDALSTYFTLWLLVIYHFPCSPKLQMYQKKLRHWQRRKVAPFWEIGNKAFPITCTGVRLVAVEMGKRWKLSGCPSLTMWLMSTRATLQNFPNVLMDLWKRKGNG